MMMMVEVGGQRQRHQRQQRQQRGSVLAGWASVRWHGWRCARRASVHWNGWCCARRASAANNSRAPPGSGRRREQGVVVSVAKGAMPGGVGRAGRWMPAPWVWSLSCILPWEPVAPAGGGSRALGGPGEGNNNKKNGKRRTQLGRRRVFRASSSAPPAAQLRPALSGWVHRRSCPAPATTERDNKETREKFN